MSVNLKGAKFLVKKGNESFLGGNITNSYFLQSHLSKTCGGPTNLNRTIFKAGELEGAAKLGVFVTVCSGIGYIGKKAYSFYRDDQKKKYNKMLGKSITKGLGKAFLYYSDKSIKNEDNDQNK
jgi:hypothetical protein